MIVEDVAHVTTAQHRRSMTHRLRICNLKFGNMFIFNVLISWKIMQDPLKFFQKFQSTLAALSSFSRF